MVLIWNLALYLQQQSPLKTQALANILWKIFWSNHDVIYETISHFVYWKKSGQRVYNTLKIKCNTKQNIKTEPERSQKRIQSQFVWFHSACGRIDCSYLAHTDTDTDTDTDADTDTNIDTDTDTGPRKGVAWKFGLQHSFLIRLSLYSLRSIKSCTPITANYARELQHSESKATPKD